MPNVSGMWTKVSLFGGDRKLLIYNGIRKHSFNMTECIIYVCLNVDAKAEMFTRKM